MKRLIAGLVGITFLLVFIADVSGDSYRVSQESSAGAGDFDSNVLGFIDPFTWTGDTSDYYDYSSGGFNDGVGGRLTLTSNLSHLFLVDASDGLSLFVVHDKPADGSGGTALTKLELSGDTASLLVKDDNGGWEPTIDVDGLGTQFTANHAWFDCCTDGLALGSLDGFFTMYVQFTAPSTGLGAGWAAISDDGSATGSALSLTPSVGRRVRIDAIPDPIPEPSTLAALISMGLVGLVIAWRRRKRAA